MGGETIIHLKQRINKSLPQSALPKHTNKILKKKLAQHSIAVLRDEKDRFKEALVSESFSCLLLARTETVGPEGILFLILRFVDNLGIKENGLYSTWGGGCPSMLMYAWYVFKSCPAPGGRVGRILLAFVPGIWIIGGEEEASGGDGDGGGLVRSGVTIGEGRSDLYINCCSRQF